MGFLEDWVMGTTKKNQVTVLEGYEHAYALPKK